MAMLLKSFFLFLIPMLVVSTGQRMRISDDDGKVCLATYSEAVEEEEDCATKHSKVGLVEPSHVAQLSLIHI